MKNYKAKIKFVSPYLQARFSEKAKEELLQDARKTIIRNLTEEDSEWLRLSYFDEDGYYIPGEQFESALVNSAKDFKMKAKRCSLKEYIKATLFVVSDKARLNKKEPDELVVSYPKRKDGNRVKITHPTFNIGNEVEFELQCLDDDFSSKTIKEIIINAGKKCGVGGRRPKFGRFELIDFNLLNNLKN